VVIASNLLTSVVSIYCKRSGVFTGIASRSYHQRPHAYNRCRLRVAEDTEGSSVDLFLASLSEIANELTRAIRDPLDNLSQQVACSGHDFTKGGGKRVRLLRRPN